MKYSAPFVQKCTRFKRDGTTDIYYEIVRYAKSWLDKNKEVHSTIAYAEYPYYVTVRFTNIDNAKARLNAINAGTIPFRIDGPITQKVS